MARATLAYSSERPSMEYLSHLGPHRVSAGDLDAIGISGLVFAPESGPRLPAVVFGHGLLQPAHRYADTLRYLASWGFVAAAPNSERGPLPSYAGLALDLSRVADRLADAKLGGGRVTVDGNRLAAMGHGIGGGAAVLAAAAAAPPVQAVVTIAAGTTTPSAVDAAARVPVPGLHLVGTRDVTTTPAGGDCATGVTLARAWAGPVQLRSVKGRLDSGLADGSHWTSYLMGTKSDKGAQSTVRTLATAFLLLHAAGQDQLAEEMDGKVAGTKPESITAAENQS